MYDSILTKKGDLGQWSTLSFEMRFAVNFLHSPTLDISEKRKINGAWKGKSIGSIPPGAVPMIRLMQQQGATREDIIAFIKKAKTNTIYIHG